MPVLMYCSATFTATFLDRYHAMSTTTVVQTQHRPSSRSVFPGRGSEGRFKNYVAQVNSSKKKFRHFLRIEVSFRDSKNEILALGNLLAAPSRSRRLCVRTSMHFSGVTACLASRISKSKLSEFFAE